VAGIVALLLQPLRDRAQLWVDRLFFRERYDTSLMLQRLSQTASSVLNIDILASMILDEINSTMHISKTALFLKDSEIEGYSLIAQRGMDADTRIVLRQDSPIVQWLSSRSGMLTRHTLDVFPQFKGLWSQERADLNTMEAELFVPLPAREELIGILMLGPKRAEGAYTSNDRLTLMTLANQTAIAVQNAWSYQTAIAEKERTEIILHQAFAGIMVVDQDMRITAVNPGAESITQYPEQELLGQRFSDIFQPKLWNEKSSLHTARVTQKTVPPTETVLQGKVSSRDILLGVTPIYDGFLLNFTDITELKEVERLKSNIVANVSHELRTPLAGIKGYAELLLNEYEGENKHLRHQFLSIINDETDRMNRFITDLLDLSRLESGQTEPQKEYLFLDKIINESLRALAVQRNKAGIDVRVDSPDEIPLIWANRDLMTSVVKNLVSNAIKYSPSGGRVDIVIRPSEHSLSLTIADQGLGIPDEEIPYLFTKFYRTGAAQSSGIGGTGLGLALAKEAVQAHDGTISVASEIGVGTRFTVTLPTSNEEPASIDESYAVPQTAG
jgi:PAS domain S-box-containing protein